MQTWLNFRLKEPALANFSVWDIEERQDSGSRYVDILGPAVADHLMSPDLLSDITKLLPPGKRRAFIEGRTPNSTRLRRGVLGEVLAVRYLEDIGGFTVPIKKLRYRTANHDSPKATDVLAVRTDADLNIIEVAYVEAKLRTTRTDIANIPLQAHNQLQKDCSEEMPAIMLFAAQILSERESPLFVPLMKYLASREDRGIDSHHIFLVVDEACWRDSDLAGLVEHDDILDPLDVYVVCIDTLPSKSDRVFASVGYEVIADDD